LPSLEKLIGWVKRQYMKKEDFLEFSREGNFRRCDFFKENVFVSNI